MFSSDAYAFINMFIFGFSNGYTTSGIYSLGPEQVNIFFM